MTAKTQAIGNSIARREQSKFEKYGDLLGLFAIALMAFGFLLSWQAPHHSWREVWGMSFFVPLANFLLFLYLLLSKAIPPLLDYLYERHHRIAESIKSFDEKSSEIAVKYKEIRDKFQNVDSEVEEIISLAKERADHERKELIAAAEKKARQLIADTEQQGQQELDRIRRSIQTKLIELSFQKLENILKENFKPEDQDRILQQFIDDTADKLFK